MDLKIEADFKSSIDLPKVALGGAFWVHQFMGVISRMLFSSNNNNENSYHPHIPLFSTILCSGCLIL